MAITHLSLTPNSSPVTAQLVETSVLGQLVVGKKAEKLQVHKTAYPPTAPFHTSFLIAVVVPGGPVCLVREAVAAGS